MLLILTDSSEEFCFCYEMVSQWFKLVWSIGQFTCAIIWSVEIPAVEPWYLTRGCCAFWVLFFLMIMHVQPVCTMLCVCLVPTEEDIRFPGSAITVVSAGN